MAVSVQSESPDVIAGRLGILVSARGATTTIALKGEWDLAHQQATRQAIRRRAGKSARPIGARP